MLKRSTAIGNGGKTDKYVWTQQLSDLNVVVYLPPGTKTKMLDVKITNNRLKVGCIEYKQDVVVMVVAVMNEVMIDIMMLDSVVDELCL